MEQKEIKQINFNEIFKIRKYIILPVVSFGLILLLSFLVVIPKVRSIYEKRKELNEVEKNLEQLENKLAFLESINENEASEKIEVIEKVLPSNKTVLDWILSVKGLSDQNNIEIGSIELEPGSIATDSASPSAISRIDGSSTSEDSSENKTGNRGRKPENNLEFFELNLLLKGNLGDLINFISASTEMYPIVRIIDMQLLTKTEQAFSRDALMQFPMQIKTKVLLFYSNHPKTIGSVSEKLAEILASEENAYNTVLEYKNYKKDDLYEIEVGKEEIFGN